MKAIEFDVAACAPSEKAQQPPWRENYICCNCSNKWISYTHSIVIVSRGSNNIIEKLFVGSEGSRLALPVYAGPLKLAPVSIMYTLLLVIASRYGNVLGRLPSLDVCLVRISILFIQTYSQLM